MAEHARQPSMLPDHMGGGPHGVGDPDDKTLRKVEREIVIPKMMKERAKVKCSVEVQVFNECGKKAQLLLPFKCQKEVRAMNDCMIRWFQNAQFVEEMTQEYLELRSEYRRTGIGKPYKRM